jgi:hypothetical protein
MKQYPNSQMRVKEKVPPYKNMPEKMRNGDEGSPMGVQKWPKMAN